jgi:hypothetical protein
LKFIKILFNPFLSDYKKDLKIIKTKIIRRETGSTMLALNLKEIKIIEEDKKKLTHKEKMKLSRTDRKVNKFLNISYRILIFRFLET